MFKLLAIAAVVLSATAAKAQSFTDTDQKCITDQFIWLENEGYAKRETFDEIAKRSLRNCGYEWRAGIYRPAFDFALKNLEFQDIDDRKRKQYAAAEKAKAARIEKAVKEAATQQARMNDCAASLAETLHNNKKSNHWQTTEAYASQAAKECGSWPKSWTDAEIEANGDYLAAFEAARQKIFDLQLDEFMKSPKPKTVKSVPVDATPASQSPWSNWTSVLIMAGCVVFTVRELFAKRRERRQQPVTTIDLSKTEWTKTKIDPIFDIKPDSHWH